MTLGKHDSTRFVNPVNAGIPQGADRRRDHEQHDHPEHDGAYQAGGLAAWRELLDESATRVAGQAVIDAGLAQTLPMILSRIFAMMKPMSRISSAPISWGR